MTKIPVPATEPAAEDPALRSPRFLSKEGRFFSPWSYHLLRLALAAVFIGSGLAKLYNPDAFAILIDAYGIIPQTWTSLVAYGLSSLEVIAGIGLLFDLYGALTIITLLVLLFICILGYGIHMGLDVDCGCFGPGDPEAQAYHGLRPALYRDFFMLASILYIYVWRARRHYKPKYLYNLKFTTKRS